MAEVRPRSTPRPLPPLSRTDAPRPNTGGHCRVYRMAITTNILWVSGQPPYNQADPRATVKVVHI